MQLTVPDDAILIPKEAKLVFEGVMFDVYQWPQKLFDGTTATYEMLKRPDTAELLCIKDGKLIVLNEQQSGRPTFLRFPGGRVEGGESWETAAARECKEELGLSFASWKLVAVTQPFTKLDWFVATLVATDVTEETAPNPDAGERIETQLLDIDELKERMRQDHNPLLNHARSLFDTIDSIDQLLALPTFSGKTVER